jgi:hypothetical protein
VLLAATKTKNSSSFMFAEGQGGTEVKSGFKKKKNSIKWKGCLFLIDFHLL